jgi:zinc transporter ZupT
MVSLIDYKIIAGILIFLTSLVAVIYPIKIRAHPGHRPSLELADAFASGIFLGAALFHMLPDAIHDFSALLGNTTYPWPELLCALGFLILLFLERLSESFSATKKRASFMPYMMTLILIIHSLIEGTALGINTTLASASIIFLAIIAHKGSESFALAIILNRSQLSLIKIIIIIGFFSFMTPLGIAIGTTSTTFLQYHLTQWLTAGFTAFAAGTFLYMSTLHHINHHHHMHEAENMMEFLFLLIGLMLMAILAMWA